MSVEEHNFKDVLDRYPMRSTGRSWVDSILAGDFSGSLEKIESELAQNGDDVEARLWWVLCQSELRQIPISALSAPMEELAAKIRDYTAMHGLASYLFLKIAWPLIEKKQTRLAFVMMERAVEFAQLGPGFNEQLVQSLITLAKEVGKEELKRAEVRREPKQYLQSIQQKIDSLKRIATEPSLVNQPVARERAEKEEERSRPGFINARSIISEAQEVMATTPPVGQKEGKSSQNLRIILASVAILIVVALILLRGLLPKEREDLSEMLAFAVIPSSVSGIQLPELVSGNNAGALEKLDQVQRRLESMRQSSAVSPPVVENQNWGGVNNQAKDVGDVPTAMPTAELPAPPVREQAAKPPIDTDKLGEIVVNDLGTMPGRAPVVDSGGQLRVGPDGRIYGPPQEKDPVPSGNGKALDGSPLKSYEVEQYNPPARYRTITVAKVLSAPSVLAQPIASLPNDARVDVVSRMGQWLEIRSKKGKKGYIYSQDAVIVAGR